MNEFNSAAVIATLRLLIKILDDHNIKYRFFGSVVLAAINGKLHRNIGDLDLLVDSTKIDILDRELKKLNYTQASGILFKYASKYLFLETFDHPNLLSVGYFYGK